MIDDFDTQTQKTKKTKRSVSKKKSLKKKDTKVSSAGGELSPTKTEDKIVVN